MRFVIFCCSCLRCIVFMCEMLIQILIATHASEISLFFTSIKNVFFLFFSLFFLSFPYFFLHNEILAIAHTANVEHWVDECGFQHHNIIGFCRRTDISTKLLPIFWVWFCCNSLNLLKSRIRLNRFYSSCKQNAVDFVCIGNIFHLRHGGMYWLGCASFSLLSRWITRNMRQTSEI